MDSDEALYHRTRRGDLAAFDELYARYERRLFGYLIRLLGNRAEAEDVFHEAFLSVLESREVSFAEGSFNAWIYRVARNLCLNRARTEGRKARAESRLAVEVSAPPPAAEERVADGQVAHALARAVNRLPSALAELFHLRSAGLSYQEMSALLALPIGTVKSRMHQLVHQLKEDMEPWTAS